nr:hypothetical protein Itr_chr01CG19520 [Ipomoea trifida]
MGGSPALGGCTLCKEGGTLVGGITKWTKGCCAVLISEDMMGPAVNGVTCGAGGDVSEGDWISTLCLYCMAKAEIIM